MPGYFRVINSGLTALNFLYATPCITALCDLCCVTYAVLMRYF